MSAGPNAIAIEPDVRAAVGGDREAFVRLIDATRSLVCGIALAIVRDVELSRDVAQDVFLSAWVDLKKLRDPASFLPWLRQVTRNRAHHVLRTQRRCERRFTVQADELLAAAVDPGRGPADELLAVEQRRMLADMIASLPDETREVVTLYYREGQSAAQVASLLDLTEDAVRQRLLRARTRLRHEVLDRLGEHLKATAPGAGFTAAVMVALSVAAPSTAAAAGLGLSKAAGSSKLLAKLALVFGGAGLGAVGGILGVLVGIGQVRRQARDEQERRDLRRFAGAASAWVVAAAIAFAIIGRTAHHPAAAISTFVVFTAGLAAMHAGWLPRIVARRHSSEFLENPDAAAARRRRERRWAIVGWTLGLLGGTAGLIAGLLLTR